MAFSTNSGMLTMIKERLQIEDFEWNAVNVKFVVATGIAVPIAYYLIQTCRDIWFYKITLGREVNKFPGPPTNMLTGNLHQHPGPNEKALDWFADMAKEYKTVMRFWMGPIRPFVILVHPDSVKELLKTAEPKIVSKHSSYQFLVPWLGYGLLTSGGQQWARNRRLLTPAFHFDVLKPYVNIYSQGAEKFVENLRKSHKSGQSVEIYQLVSLCTLETVLKCAFSYGDDVQGVGKSHPYVNAVETIADLVVDRAFKPWLRNDWMYALSSNGRRLKNLCHYVHQVADEIINKRRETITKDPTVRKEKYRDFLDILLCARDEDDRGLTDLEIRQEVDTFLFEGHDTTASAISWTLYSLAQHPEIQEKARREVLTALEQTDSHDFEWESLRKMPYLTQCIKEGMRMHSPVPAITRELSQELRIAGVDLPRCALVNINVHAVHHNCHVWGDDHMDYKPERFHPDEAKKHDSHAFIPFSAGPRNCIGQNFAMGEMKVIIGKVLQRFRLNIDPNHVPYKMPALVMRAKNGIRLKLSPL